MYRYYYNDKDRIMFRYDTRTKILEGIYTDEEDDWAEQEDLLDYIKANNYKKIPAVDAFMILLQVQKQKRAVKVPWKNLDHIGEK